MAYTVIHHIVPMDIFKSGVRITLRINPKTRLIQSTYIIIIFLSLIFHLRKEWT